jgi:hypothetical protein
MAGIKITGKYASVNPTTLFIPVNKNGVFVDSNAKTNDGQSVFFTQFPGITGGDKGIYLDSSTQVYKLGDFNNVQNGVSIVLDDANTKIKIQGTNTVTTGGVHSITTKFLNLNVQGIDYVIQLLTP